jgi:hypothetical protein
MEKNFDIVIRDNIFVLYCNGSPYRTERGMEITHPNARLMRWAISHELFSKDGSVSPLGLLTKLSDFPQLPCLYDKNNVEDELSKDRLLKREQKFSDQYIDALTEDPFPVTDFIFLSSSSLASSLGNFLSHKEKEQNSFDYCVESIKNLSPEQKIVLDALHEQNKAGLLIHLIFLNGYLSHSEYTTGLMLLNISNNNGEILHAIQTNNYGRIAEIRQHLMRNGIVAHDFLILCKNANRVSVIEEIIKRGEDNQTEFKSTLRWDLRQAIKSVQIEHASLKTICAFLNTEGGDLLIGVRDDGTIEGIETDKFDSDDRFLLHLWTLIKTCLGQEVVEWVNTTLQKFGEKTVCRIHCKKATKPVFLNQKGFDESFYIRTGPSSSNLEISSALKYIQQHFS